LLHGVSFIHPLLHASIVLRCRVAFEPLEHKTAATNFCTNVARKMISPFAPIEARPAIDATATRYNRQICTKSVQKFSTTIGDLTSIIVQNYVTVLSQSVSDCHTEAPGNVVVTRSSVPQRLFACRSWLVARRYFECGDCLHVFQHARHKWRANAIVVEPSLLGDGDKPR
jgi:hypothetical protein